MEKIALERVVLGKCVLTQFQESMIGKYHEWMQDSFLLESTCTEPLSLDEVHNLSETWKKDPLTYVYIICDREIYEEERQENSMIGDVDLFIKEEGQGEINIMIADERFRGKGIASEVIAFVKVLAKEKLGLRKLVAKVKESNADSRKLFEKQGFVEFNRVADFEEIHYEYVLN